MQNRVQSRQKIPEQHQKTSNFLLGWKRLFYDASKRLADTFLSTLFRFQNSLSYRQPI